MSGTAAAPGPPPVPGSGRVAVWGDGLVARALHTALGATGRLYPPDRHLAGHSRGDPHPDTLLVVTDAGFVPSALLRVNRWVRRHRATALPVHSTWDGTTIGPWLRPEEPGCYQCLATRMRMARAGGPGAEADLWQRFADGRLAVPEPVLPAPLLATVAALVADECARLRADRSPRTRHAVLRVRPDARAVDRHRFLPDPACEVCGGVPPDSPDLAVVTLRPRPARDADSCRGATPHRRALVERFVDPRTGVIHSVRVDHRGATVNAAAVIHPACAPVPGGVADGGGRTLDRDSSVAVAILEALERYAGITADLSKRTVVTASYRELPAPAAIDPRTLGLPPAEQVAASDEYTAYHPDLPITWVWGWSFRRARPVLVPECVGYYYRRPGPLIAYECSSGCALGSCLEEAILHGLFEVAERDGFLLTWYARLPVPRIDWRTVRDPVTRLLAARLEATTGHRLHLLNITMPEGVPAVAAMVVDEEDRPGHTKAFFGGGAHLAPERAIRSAVGEVALADGRSPLSAADAERARAMLADADLVTELAHHAWRYSLPEAWPRLAFLAAGPVVAAEQAFPPGAGRTPSGDLAEDLRYAVGRYLRSGLDVLVVDQTIPEQRAAGVACAKVVIPGTLPMTFGHRNRRTAGIPRLRTVPARLGYRRGRLPESAINPDPHPFP